MSDIQGGAIGNKLWDDRAAIVAKEHQADREKAFQRTRMAPAVSHERARPGAVARALPTRKLGKR